MGILIGLALGCAIHPDVPNLAEAMSIGFLAFIHSTAMQCLLLSTFSCRANLFGPLCNKQSSPLPFKWPIAATVGLIHHHFLVQILHLVNSRVGVSSLGLREIRLKPWSPMANWPCGHPKDVGFFFPQDEDAKRQ